MKSSEITLTGRDLLNYELHDGYGEEGGISHEHYTLKEYLKDIAYDEEDYKEWLDADIYRINNTLVLESGIAPIPYNFERERQQLACFATYYVGVLAAGRDVSVPVSECIEWANQYDFEVNEVDGAYVVDMEAAKEDAKAFSNVFSREMEVEEEYER